MSAAIQQGGHLRGDCILGHRCSDDILARGPERSYQDKKPNMNAERITHIVLGDI